MCGCPVCAAHSALALHSACVGVLVMNVVCSWLICSGYRLHQVDVVVMNSVYSIMLDEVGTLDAASRVLRRDGRLVLSHPLGREFVTNLQQQVRACTNLCMNV